jgi:cation diffusion facilitator CzcD-associated flavoprotein CzcO
MADTADNVKRVAIIGAGLSGLLSLYHLKTSRTKIKLTAFEKNFNIGGTWLYTDQTYFIYVMYLYMCIYIHVYCMSKCNLY